MCASAWVMETRARNESESGGRASSRPAPSADQHPPGDRGLSGSVHVGTRKMVNYA
jgi:hypothetical protein